MEELVDIGIWIAGAVIAVGILQWAKGVLPSAPSRFWTVVLPAVSFAASFAAAAKTGDYSGAAWNALGVWAVAQIGYELIIQTIRKRLGGAA